MALPGAPTGLTADVVGPSYVTVIWLAPDSNGGEPITGYVVEHTSDGWPSWATTTVADVLSATINGLSSTTTYSIRVAAINASGTGTYSDTITVTTTSPPPPPPGGGGGAGPASFPPPGYVDISSGARLNELAGTTGESPTTAANALAGTTGESLTTALNIAAGTTGESATTALNILAGTTGEPAAEAARKIGSNNVNPG